MAFKALKIAVVGGSGYIGKRHCQHVVKNPSTQLIAIVDPSSAAEETAKLHDVALYSSIQDLLNSSHVPDAAIVCTPNHTHVAISSELARAGVHILCEKPISIDIDSGSSLIREARQHSVKLLIGHHRRFNPYTMAMKQILESGKLGEITAVSGLWLTYKPDAYFAGDALQWRRSKKTGGGVILVNFIHEIDLMHHFFGPVSRIHAEKTINRRAQHEDAPEEGAAITMRFESGVVGTFVISDNASSPHTFEQGTGENPLIPRSGMDTYRVFGTKGTLSFPDMTLSTYPEEISWENPMRSENISVSNADIPPFDSQLDHFVGVCNNQLQPSCSGEEGLRAMVVCEAVRSALDDESGGGTRTIQMPV